MYKIKFSVLPSTIEPPCAGRSLVMNPAEHANIIIIYCYGCIVNTHRATKEGSTMMPGDRIMEASMVDFDKWAVEKGNKLVGKPGKKRNGWICLHTGLL